MQNIPDMTEAVAIMVATNNSWTMELELKSEALRYQTYAL